MFLWETKFSAGCVAIAALLIFGFGLILIAGLVDINSIGQVGLGLVGSGLALAIMRDNQRTRRMLRRPGERVAPMHSVPPEGERRDWI